MNCNWSESAMMYWHGSWMWLGLMLAIIVLALFFYQSRRGAQATQNCSGCSGEIQPTYLRCPHCGDILKSHCPHCSRIVEKEWTYCPDCQATLTKK